ESGGGYRQLTAKCHRILRSAVFSSTCAYSSSSESTCSPSVPSCCGSFSSALSSARTVVRPSLGEYHCGGGNRRNRSWFPAPSSIKSDIEFSSAEKNSISGRTPNRSANRSSASSCLASERPFTKISNPGSSPSTT